MPAMPSLFISHGGPNVVTDESPARTYLMGLSHLLPKPKAIVIVSAHFETGGVAVVTDPAPGMIYDFGGFAPELYEMVYPAPGSPELAERVIGMLDGAGFAPYPLEKRGYDHGAWTPLKLAFPDADIPVVQVSIDPNRDAAWHYALGRALAPLREEGILLIGSGHITHNLRALFPVMRHGNEPDPELTEKVNAFTTWFAERFAEGDREAILDWKNRAPFPAENHPTDEHLMPIFFAYGAGGDSPRVERAHSSMQYGFFAWDSYLFH
ncbi:MULTISPECIES: class III extradiol ring-cleavage dioxygenase [unclassified Aminobacter]|uniref:DODA-type extradiol aromatic ring-opening family dioxygenase n=1 Tax=unclassified Aminobacter TaxID=2644704 RepID=UPI00046327F4|nr:MULTISPECIES: class III extradiol ring-cleavage dioxygenase [unclassified Aminobacter]TWH24483.1 4,5-DOPA dioxygenase extradiol [Aminobacter sp. J15]